MDEKHIDAVTNLKIRVSDIEKSFSEVQRIIAMREEVSIMREERSRLTGEKVDKLYDVLIGDGTKDKPSVVVRVDRLEQSEESRKWLWVGMGTLLLNAAWEWLKTKSSHGG